MLGAPLNKLGHLSARSLSRLGSIVENIQHARICESYWTLYNVPAASRGMKHFRRVKCRLSIEKFYLNGPGRILVGGNQPIQRERIHATGRGKLSQQLGLIFRWLCGEPKACIQ